MTWIALDVNVWWNKKIVRAANLLTKGDVQRLVGHVSRLWCWAIDHAESGDLSHLDDSAIALAAGWPNGQQKFVAALHDAGLLVDRRIASWDEHAGRLLARRRQDRERRARQRADAARMSAPQSTSEAA